MGGAIGTNYYSYSGRCFKALPFGIEVFGVFEICAMRVLCNEMCFEDV
jgi:hypothetical protein